jgi:hypothetical protein
MDGSISVTDAPAVDLGGYRFTTTGRRRAQRDLERVRRAAAVAQARGASAVDQALAQLGAAFDEAATINAFKLRVERMLRRGPEDPGVRARFAARAAMLEGRRLDAATATVERWWREERKAFQIASAFGCATRLSLDILSELRLILRLLRFKRMAASYEAAIAALCSEPLATAAE